jgi:hypothetical protein
MSVPLSKTFRANLGPRHDPRLPFFQEVFQTAVVSLKLKLTLGVVAQIRTIGANLNLVLDPKPLVQKLSKRQKRNRKKSQTLLSLSTK